MNGCMEIDKPRIAILMAVYEPRMDWLREQLESLEAQTYSNLRLYIRDDCSPTVPFAEIERCVEACIHSFPWTITRNEENLGSNGTFQRLTEEAEGEYFAYCDQDDIWLPEKLTVLREELERSGALLVCSDMFIIDGAGRQTADSITKVRRHHVFHSGENLAANLVFSNFVTGCTMLIRAEVAKAAVSFCPYMVHDHYLALFAAERGKIVSLPERLIKYRIHGNNQTEMMAGVKDKASYGQIRIDEALEKMRWLEENFSCDSELKEVIRQGKVWLEARQKNWHRQGGAKTVWRYRGFNKAVSCFELVLSGAPNWLFQLALAMKKKNLL